MEPNCTSLTPCFSVVSTPCSLRMASMASFLSGATLASTMFCAAVRRTSVRCSVTIWRNALFSFTCSVSLTRPASTCRPRKRLPSYCSCQPCTSPCWVNSNGRGSSSATPARSLTSFRNHSTPCSAITYFNRACLRLVRSPKSRCTVKTALENSMRCSGFKKPTTSATRG